MISDYVEIIFAISRDLTNIFGFCAAHVIKYQPKIILFSPYQMFNVRSIILVRIRKVKMIVICTVSF